MREYLCQVEDPLGIHARPASQLFMEAVKYQCSIKAICNGIECNVKNILEIMGMGAVNGSRICFRFDGIDEETAMKSIQNIMERSM